ncbi:relaxase/mobilization nuclease domain-containing protein [Hymenobacter sp. ISL-91]|uniref:relaxase/mobilization nuclease domain-containing protein n=1 Tax=Hymenobacter sp. ISL-91 TaxID=2819151 RepID=UPI001BECA79F|nr:relaxase/mobilization nuclease domain-containing protein [Hymenobacter sp. ISL-91]MBT2557948.1 relaxase/mobilization nuclease domain-containing protein [Hymenobacter sp. ISL-91]
MIGKVKIGKSFVGICRYVLQQNRQAQVLEAEGVRTDSAAHMAQDFHYQQRGRPGLGNAVMHVALALPVADTERRTAEEVSELLRQIGKAYVREMKLENTQWVLVQHTDKAHAHAHLIVNRVDNNGQAISDKFVGQQSRRVCQQLEQQLGLTVAEQRGREQAREAGKTHRQQVAITPQQIRTADWQRARHEVANALKDVASNSGSFEELKMKLAPKGIALEQSTHQKKNAPTMFGVVFEKNGHRMKGSEVGKQYSAGNLEKGFAQAPRASQPIAEKGETRTPAEGDIVTQVPNVERVQGSISVPINPRTGVGAEKRAGLMKEFLDKNGFTTQEIIPPAPGLSSPYMVLFSYSPTDTQLDKINKILHVVQQSGIDTIREAPHLALTLDRAKPVEQAMADWEEREGQHNQACIVVNDTTKKGQEKAERIQQELKKVGVGKVGEIINDGYGQLKIDVHYHTHAPTIKMINHTLDGAALMDGVQVQESDNALRARKLGQDCVREKNEALLKEITKDGPTLG